VKTSKLDLLRGKAMPVTSNCPNCGAQLEYQGGDATFPCQYCGSTVVVPEDLQPAQAQVNLQKMLTWPELRKNRWFKIGVVFFFVVFVLPTCIGLVASLLGITVGIGAPFAAVILQYIFGR
jgi:hypothetical protein